MISNVKPKFRLRRQWRYFVIIFKSLFYNHFISWSYVCDILLEPIFRCVENFTTILGPIFVMMVILITALTICTAYFLGLPYWWNRSPVMTVLLVIIGNWLLINVLFHYYMGVTTKPGYPPKGGLIPEASSICKKCIKPKPPRTHHCSVCKTCILKMDHHCPWINNCVGHQNHRYFFLYMVFTLLGMIFLIIFGIELAYDEFFQNWDQHAESPTYNSTSDVQSFIELWINTTAQRRKEVEIQTELKNVTSIRRKLILITGLIAVATLVTLGALAWWHAGLITRGETSIEGRINQTLEQKFKLQGKKYKNPYDFGPRENWKLFLGLKTKTWWHILFPSTHEPYGNGLTWQTAEYKKY